MSYKLLLCEWGLEKYIEKFEDEEIDDESFPFLEKEKISDLFPKVGPYSKFIRLYNNWIHDKENNEPASTPVCTLLNLIKKIIVNYLKMKINKSLLFSKFIFQMIKGQ
ncbi:uncharacterized protein LOC122502306 [Leptopilina heterotoma]|uniref:uncharacterized protein LOC122502306 n=1 Tax=Leptopilina heterotoma TaxID=63436 RepID=UPI001CA7C67B|nr:uncharacterized protein LOC122502306 [Leptopilina heterotoma]